MSLLLHHNASRYSIFLPAGPPVASLFTYAVAAASRPFRLCFPVQIPARCFSYFSPPSLSLLRVHIILLLTRGIINTSSTRLILVNGSADGKDRDTNDFDFKNRLSGSRGRCAEAARKWTREIYVLTRCAHSFSFFTVYRCRKQKAIALVCRIIYSRATLLHYLNIFSHVWHMA